MHDFFKKIIDEGVWAPSGDNSQPWHFKIKGDMLEVYVTPEIDHPILNVGNSGSYIAHGALLENMVIAAREHGKEISIELFPQKNDPKFLARVKVTGFAKHKDYLFHVIRKRHTNRKAYKSDALTVEQQAEILKSIDKLPKVTFKLIDDQIKRKEIAKAASVMEEVALENQDLHRLFFVDILWKAEENKQGKMGLHIETLELPLPIQILFKILKYWKVTKIFNKIGFSKLASKGNAQVYHSGAATGVIAIPKSSPEQFIIVGRALQRIWLTVTYLGLSMQPVTGILFLAERIKTGEFKEIDKHHEEMALAAYQKIKSIFNLHDEVIAMMFRIGKADPATARTYRKNPTITIDTT